jgi:Tol biopolymer transport system component
VDNADVVSTKKSMALVAAVGIALIALSGGSAATTSPWIVFAASPDHGTRSPQLFRVRTSGSGLKQITSGLHPAVDPAFSPSGGRVAFARMGLGLFVGNADGTGVRRLTRSGSARYPVWSPNGRRIAFIRGGGASYRLWLMNENGQRQHRLSLAPSTLARPAWMPDGKSLVIASGGAFYRVSPLSGKIETRLVPTYDGTLGQLFWTLSPNGRLIAYEGRRPPPPGCQGAACEVFALYLQGVGTSYKSLIDNDAAVAGWSPDGRHIVYARGGALNVQDLGGGAARSIAVGDAALDGEAPPAWQPR